MTSIRNKSRSIKYYVQNFIQKNRDLFDGKVAIDFPAGNGFTTEILKKVGAITLPFDLFPEFFRVKDTACIKAHIKNGLPIEVQTADWLICQEGLEHFSDQLHALTEFNRVLKDNGKLLITTPNYSNLRAKMSYLLTESERVGSYMPPNECDSIWFAQEGSGREPYLGHIFLLGIFKLRIMWRLAGFELIKIHPTRIKVTSFLLFPLIYPFIVLSHFITLLKNLGKQSNSRAIRSLYYQLFFLGVQPRTLLDSHLMVELQKKQDPQKIHQNFWNDFHVRTPNQANTLLT